MGLEEALILVYLLVDDAYRIVRFGGRVRQRGPEPKLSDLEVLSLEIFGEQPGRHHDAAIQRYCAGHWRHFFPDLASYQAFARHCAALSLIKQRILELLFAARDTLHSVDGFAIPVCHACRGKRCRTFRGEAAWGSCATKKEHFYGLRGHRVIDLVGLAVAFTVTAATVDEREVVPNRYAKIRGLLIGDKGFISGDLKATAAAHAIDLQRLLRKNMPDPRDPDTLARLMRIRRAVETAIGKLSEMVAAQTTKARDLRGVVNRMARKLLADNFSLIAAQL
jgi:Transposase DDE domain